MIFLFRCVLNHSQSCPANSESENFKNTIDKNGKVLYTITWLACANLF